MTVFLNTEQAAAYLSIGERKLYELVAQGAVPCSKVTGKWLFPRDALDRWIDSGMVRPPGLMAETPPPIIGGSHDPLLEWTARRSGSGLALLSEGSGQGLARLEANEVALAAIHCHRHGPDDPDANIEAVLAMPRLHDAVIIHLARREQGLLLRADVRPVPVSLAQALAMGLRLGHRQAGAGAEMLLARLLQEAGLAADGPARVHETGQELAFAIRAGDCDVGIASRSVADANGLAFVPLATEFFDLVLRRRSYFEPGPQKLFALLRDEAFHHQASRLGGYDTGQAGLVRLNR